MSKTTLISSVPDSSVPFKERTDGTDGTVSKKHRSSLSVSEDLGMDENAWERMRTDGLKRPPSMVRNGAPK
jgi:hypothetical protein